MLPLKMMKRKKQIFSITFPILVAGESSLSYGHVLVLSEQQQQVGGAKHSQYQ